MRFYAVLLLFFAVPALTQAQFTPSEKALTIIVTDGTDEGRDSQLQPKMPGDHTQAKGLEFLVPIRSLGMSDAIQAAAFLDRPDYGIAGFLLVFCVNDSINKKQGLLEVNGEIFRGVYRLIRQKISLDEEIPEGMRPYRLGGTVFFLGIS